MDVSFKATKQNIKNFNPMNYSEEAMQSNHITDEDMNSKSVDSLMASSRTLQEDLGFTELSVGELNGLKKIIPFDERKNKTKAFARTQSVAMSKTTKLFGNSDEMQAIITNVNGLNSILEQEIPRTNDGRIDVERLKKYHLKGYEAALSACQYYLDVKDPTYSWGKARYARVEATKRALENEKNYLEVVISNVADHKYSEDELKNIQTPRDLLDKARSMDVIGNAELQMEGNSTDVYRIKLKVNGEFKWFYFKQNLKPIGDDLPGFVKRRLRQVNNSKTHFGQDGNEEARLKDKIDQSDYDMGIEFLTEMQTKIKANAGDIGDSRALNNRYIKFLGHDYDSVFKQLDEYNVKARESYRKKAELQNKIENTINDKALKETYQNELQNMVTFEPMTEYQWIEQLAKDKNNPLGLDKKKDKALFEILKRMSETQEDPKLAKNEGENNRIRRFFTRTLGKEVEAFGQQKQRSNASNEEVMAKNNTATYRVANMFGFDDVVTSSESAVINIKLAGAEQSEDITGTISVEAPGLEMLRLVEIAEKKGRKIRYSSKAIRQMVRLQMFDTACMQTDRHWRNFKCLTKPDLSQFKDSDKLDQDIIIESIGSYDHDMSFGEVDLKDAFKNSKDPNGVSVKNGMLPPIIRRIKTASAENSYYSSALLGGININLYENMETPVPAEGCTYKDKHDERARQGYYRFHESTLAQLHVTEADLIKIKEGDPLYEAGMTKYRCKDLLLEKTKHDKTKYFILDSEGKKIPYAAMDANLTSDVALTLKHLKTTTYIFKDKNCVLKTGDPVPKDLTDNIETLCTELYQLIPVIQKEGYSVPQKLSELSHDDQVKALKDALLLHEYVSKIDVSQNEFENGPDAPWITNGTGYMEVRVRAIAFYLKKQLDAMKPEEKDALLAEVKTAVNAQLLKDKKEKGLKKEEKKEESEYIEVPTMLHMDAQAYKDLQRMNNQFDAEVRYLLQDLGWSEAKVAAFKTRIEQQLADIAKCKDMAEKVLALKYPNKDDKRRKFFLDKDDYDEITDISQIAWDPGMSYFATEDENFLLSETQYSQYLSEAQKSSKLASANKHRSIERLHGLKQNLTKYSTMIGRKVEKSEKNDDKKGDGAA